MKIVIIGTRGFPNIQEGVEKHCPRLAPGRPKADSFSFVSATSRVLPSIDTRRHFLYHAPFVICLLSLTATGTTSSS